MTKNGIYAYLTDLGVSRGYSVIAEFCVNVPGAQRRKKKALDLVWARKITARAPRAPAAEEWELFAAFEIEGSNVRNLPREFGRHLADFRHVTNSTRRPVQKYVVLYTSAYDRRWDNELDRDGEVQERIRWARRACFTVLDGRQLEAASSQFPRKLRRRADG